MAAFGNQQKTISPFDPVRIAAELSVRFAQTAASYDESASFPFENIRLAHEAGLIALTAPVEHGGAGAGLAVAAEVIRHVARGEPSTALILIMQYINLATIPNSGWPQNLIQRVLGDAARKGSLINAFRVEPELGTPVRGGLPKTTARRAKGGWSISGRKIYSTGVEGLTYAVVWARTDEADPRVGAFLVPLEAAGLAIEKTWNPLGMRATGSHDVVLEDVRVPSDHAVDIRLPSEWGGRSEGQAAWFGLLPGALYTGVAEAARDWLVTFLRNRVPTNLGQPLSSVPRIQHAVGEIEELIAVNRRLIASAAGDIDRGLPLPATEANLIKTVTTENAIAAVEKALKLTGNHGISRNNPLERHHRDVLCGRIHSPQEDTVRVEAGRIALGI
ncbi:acyl-CoA dehydrogenase family protein [Sinorhizobium meliloti]|uniref:acyl-CoA dehydrogenase family protein n=1 Tax=Rhizobium meliloti TaxID=382 RepID=UPI000FD73521|nr:acyl-CoA dehydrogenase family protein [Sinorhizobium meliloti]RVG74845.1 acyl-CoA dehydrogenase [Sinorhizobium meliloti]RVH36324.1 acyl-CoA dehydrogenase [Sinorhizobium meliloti]RVH54127.1 acyl-CoA dehydrogenase [Sinorhizobium meliloti]